MKNKSDVRTKRRRFTPVLIVTAMLWAGQAIGAQSGETFKARLSVTPLDAAMKAKIGGSGSLTAMLTGGKLSINGTFQGLRSPATDAQIHVAPKGIRGPAILDVTVTKATSGTISGSVDLTPAQVQDLKNSRFYLQLDSEGAPAPDGNLFGWLLR